MNLRSTSCYKSIQDKLATLIYLDMAMNKCSFSWFLVCLILITIGMKSEARDATMNHPHPPCKTYNDCWHFCGLMIPFCVEGICQCGIAPKQKNKSIRYSPNE
ncbi:hypothetical protein P3L10_011547 [Capsicum annuum]